VTQARIVERDGHRLIRLDAAAIRRAGIRSQPMPGGIHPETVDVFASVVDLKSLAQRAASLSAAAAQVRAASARLDASKAESERQQRLYEQDQTVSASQAQASRAAFLADQATLAAAQAQFEGERTAARLEWGDPLGSALPVPDRPARALTDDLIGGRRVLVQVVLPLDGAAGPSTPGAPLRGRLLLDDGRQVALDLVSPAPRTDSRIAGRAFFYSAPPLAALAPGTALRAVLPTGRTVDTAPVPPAAVVWWQGRAWIYVRRDVGDFERREVAVDLAGDRPAAAAGLDPGAELVIQGAQVLLSEELRAENFSTDVGGR